MNAFLAKMKVSVGESTWLMDLFKLLEQTITCGLSSFRKAKLKVKFDLPNQSESYTNFRRHLESPVKNKVEN